MGVWNITLIIISIHPFLGFIEVKEVMSVSMMQHHTEEEVLQEVRSSTSHRNTKRFEMKDENGKIYIRSNFGRNFEPVSRNHVINFDCFLVVPF